MRFTFIVCSLVNYMVLDFTKHHSPGQFPPLVALSPVFNPQRRPAVNQRINWSLGGRGLEYSEPFVTQRCRPSPTATLLFLSCRLQPLQFMLGTASGTVSICSALMWQKNLICALISISESKLKKLLSNAPPQINQCLVKEILLLHLWKRREKIYVRLNCRKVFVLPASAQSHDI